MRERGVGEFYLYAVLYVQYRNIYKYTQQKKKKRGNGEPYHASHHPSFKMLRLAAGGGGVLHSFFEKKKKKVRRERSDLIMTSSLTLYNHLYYITLGIYVKK